SAGAIFSSQLAARRSERLSSVVSLSGGVGGVIRDLSPIPKRQIPFFVAWGGPSDSFAFIQFDPLSKNLEAKLKDDVVVECIHDCGHSVPPFDTQLRADPAYQFIVDHPYGLPATESPYVHGLPAGFPKWCAFGAGKAIPRTETGGCTAL